MPCGLEASTNLPGVQEAAPPRAMGENSQETGCICFQDLMSSMEDVETAAGILLTFAMSCCGSEAVQGLMYGGSCAVQSGL